MAIANTTTFTLQDVVTEVTPTTNDLSDCFADAVPGDFDTGWKDLYYLQAGNVNNLLMFRNYGGTTFNIELDQELDISSDLAVDFNRAGIFVDLSGTRLYVMDHINRKISQFSMSTANTLSTMSYVDIGPSYAASVGASDFVQGVWFNTAGTKIFFGVNYVSGSFQYWKMHRYSLSTAWDITTMSTTTDQTWSPTAPFTDTEGGEMSFSQDGTVLFMTYKDDSATYTNLKTVKYVLNTAWDLTTVSNAAGVASRTFTAPSSPDYYVTASAKLVPEVNSDNSLIIMDRQSSPVTYRFRRYGDLASGSLLSSHVVDSITSLENINLNQSYHLYSIDGNEIVRHYVVSRDPVDATAPSTPTGLNAISRCQTTFTLRWTASTDNVGVTGYKIYKGGILYVDTLSTGVTYGITGQTAGASNTWTVKAYDAAANESSASSGLVVTQTPTVTETSNSITLVGKASGLAACSEHAVGDTAPRYITGGNSTPGNGETVYEDACASTVFAGGGLYYSDGNISFVISNSGTVSGIGLCTL